MLLTMLKSKIHRATVTAADLNYEGSISIDPALCDAAHLREFERVEVYNISNGERFATYVIHGNAGQIQINGAAARLAQPSDLVIICSYATYTEDEAGKNKNPVVVLVDEKNRPKRKPEVSL